MTISKPPTCRCTLTAIEVCIYCLTEENVIARFRYGILVMSVDKRLAANAGNCRNILHKLEMVDYAIGKTKVFKQHQQ